MIIMVPCYACKDPGIGMGRRSAKHQQAAAAAAIVCHACEGTGRMSVEETLLCSECRLKGKPGSSLVYQDTVGRLAVWRCSFGHDWTEVVGTLTGEHR